MINKYKLNLNNILLKNIILNEKNDIIYFKELYFISKKLNKYEILQKMILNNNFLLKEQKEYLFNIFNKYQKYFFSFKKIIYKYKYKSSKKFNNTYDLIGNNYNNLNKNHLIVILQNNTKYTFRASDLLNIWKTSLLNCSNMEPHPKTPKNPYSNVVFENYNLYNIYFQIKFNTILTIPDIIEKHFKYLFSIKLLKYMEFNMLFNNSVHEYIKHMTPDLLLFEIKHMFSKHKIFKKYILNFSKIDLNIVNNLKDVLRYYFLYNHIIHPIKRDYYEEQFLIRSKLYIKNNKNSLRRYVKVIRSLYDT